MSHIHEYSNLGIDAKKVDVRKYEGRETPFGILYGITHCSDLPNMNMNRYEQNVVFSS